MNKDIGRTIIVGAMHALSLGGLSSFLTANPKPSLKAMRRNRINDEELARQKVASIKAEEKRQRRQERNRRLQEKQQ